MPPIFKNQEDHPSSSFEHGVRSNLGNQLSQWALFVAIIGSFIATLGHPFIYTAIWYGIWWGIITLWAISARYFIVQSTDLKVNEWKDSSGNWENVCLYVSLWPIVLLGFVFRADWKLARNRYVWWNHKAYIFTADKKNPQELKLLRLGSQWIIFNEERQIEKKRQENDNDSDREGGRKG